MRRLVLSLGIVSLLAACGGGGDGTTPPTGTPGITITASASSGTIARGSSGTTTLTLGRVDGFAGAVSLTVEGAPAGVSVSFAPQSLTGTTTSSTATISVAQTAAPGNVTLTFRGSGSSVTDKTVQYTLTIPTPAITVSAGAGTASAAQGGTATVPITITRVNGASGAVTLTAEGLPANVTAAFAPTSIADGSTTSTLTLTIGAAATVTTSAITVRAAATGVADQTATVQLTVTSGTTAAYTLTAAPAAIAFNVGNSAQSVLTITRTGGFAGNVALTMEGAPSGLVGSFFPNPATGTTSTLTMTASLAVVPGTYNLTIRGVSAGLTDRTTTIAVTINAAPGVTVTLAPAALSIAQGATAQTAVTLARIGGLTGDITMTAVGAPAGMTLAFAPATVSATSSTLTVTVGAAVAAGTYNIVVTGTGAGGVFGIAPLAVTVTAPSGFTLAATNAAVVQGSTGASTITITRIGAFAGAVTLSATNVPANVTAAFNPTPAAGTSSTLTFTAAAGATPGTYTVTVNGTGTGAANQSATLTLTVTASGGGGGNIAWRFCDPARIPLWFAFRNGTSGTWTQVTPSANNTYSFTLTGAAGSVAYVSNVAGGGTIGTIFLLSTTELGVQSANECTLNPPGKSLNGTVAGLTNATQSATVSIGGTAASPSFSSPAFSLTNVDDGATDLMAIRTTTIINGTSFSIAPDRAVLRRNVNYAAGSAIPVIDLAGAESFAAATATLTLANAGSDNTNLFTTYYTPNGASGNFYAVSGVSAGTSVTQYGVPAALTQAGDFHMILASATTVDALATRAMYQFNRNIADRTITFGAALTVPTTTSVAGGPYARLRTRSTWQAEYAAGMNVNYTVNSGGSKSWTISGTRAYFGAASTDFEVELYDFSGVAGFNNSWGLTAGVSTTATTTAYGSSTGTIFAPAEGNVTRAATRLQMITP